ncbi:MAG: nuclear transport factor 2 family protein [Ferruginibacter sp.]
MRKHYFFICLIFFFLLSSSAITAQSQLVAQVEQVETAPPLVSEEEHSNKEKNHILSLEQQWLEAEMKSDTMFIGNLLDSAYMGISEYGIYTRQEEIANLLASMEDRKKNNIRIDTFEIQDCIVNLYNNTAVVTFIMLSLRNENGIMVERKSRYYDVWMKKHGKWRAVSSQGSVVKE